MPYLRFATGDRLRLDGEEMPGVVTLVEVEGENSIESLPREGKAGDIHILRGYRDFRVRIHVALAGPRPLAELKALQAKFAKSKTEPLRVVHPHLAARGIEKALFARLISREEGGEDGMVAILELTQTEPREALAERNEAAERSVAHHQGPVAGPVGSGGSQGQGERAGPPRGGAGGGGKGGSPAPSPPPYAQAFLQGRQAGLQLAGGGR